MRTNRNRTVLVVAIAAALVCGPSLATDLNGFLREKGHGDVALSYTTESYDEFWRGEEKVSNPGVGEVDTRSLSLFVAYGVARRVTLFANLPYVDAEGDGTAGFAEKDVSDLSLLAAFRLAESADGRHSLTGAAGVRTPTKNYAADNPVSVGDGTTDWLVRAVYQFRHRQFYLSQQVGYEERGGDAPNTIPLYTEIGNTWGRTTVNLFYSMLISESGTDIGDPGFTFPSNEEEYERIGAKAFVRAHRKVGVAVSAFTTLDGRNSGDATGFSLGVDFGF